MHFLAILDYSWPCDLASEVDGENGETMSDCRKCNKVKRERLDFLADNPRYTKRFAYHVGQRRRSATIKDVAADLRLDWHTV